MTDLRPLKVEAAREALGLVRDDMVVGLGTGSTSEEFVRLLGEAMSRGERRHIRGVCTSRRTEELARALAIPVLGVDELSRIDLAIDGADEIDPQLRLIKGRGGALLREKIIEQAAAKFVVIADHTKEVDRLGEGPLPVVIVPFAEHLLMKRFAGLGLEPQIRMGHADPYLTDDGNYIVDVKISRDTDIEAVVNGIYWFAGVVETGFFPHEASEAIIASPEGIRRMKRPASR